MAADASFAPEAEPPKVSAGAVQSVDAPLPNPSSDRLARDYLSKLLKNIKIMLTYATSNGISLPEDLRPKIDALLTHSDVSIDKPSPRRGVTFDF